MSIETNLQNKVAVVTGGSRGIGEAIAIRLAQEGARVLVTGQNKEHLDAVLAKLKVICPDCAVMMGDVSKEEDVERLVDYAYEMFGEVDILVNNAGLYPVTPLSELTTTEWEKVINTNLTGTFMCSRNFAMAMIRNNTKGRMVNISSTSSHIARPGVAHYASSKAGINMLTKVLAVELAPHDITVNAICPGVIETETVRLQAQKSPESQAEMEAKLQKIPLARLGKPEEIAAATLFLISGEAGYITGATLFVDGGFTLGIPKY